MNRFSYRLLRLLAALGALLASPAGWASPVPLSELVVTLAVRELDADGNPAATGPSFIVPESSFAETTDGSGDILVSHEWKPKDYVKADGTPGLVLKIENSTTINPDPFITWAISATNNQSSPMFFSFSFGTPLSPAVSGPNAVRSQISGGITDATGNGVAIAPSGTHLQNSSVAPSMSGPQTPLGVPTGHAFSGNTGTTETFSYPLDSAGFIPGPMGSWNALFTTISFTLSGDQDNVALSGNAVISPVPLPAALPMMLAGLGLFGFGALRRRPALPHLT